MGSQLHRRHWRGEVRCMHEPTARRVKQQFALIVSKARRERRDAKAAALPRRTATGSDREIGVLEKLGHVAYLHVTAERRMARDQRLDLIACGMACSQHHVDAEA